MSSEPSAKPAARHLTNQVLGLVVFVAGIALLALVFLWAWHLYEGINSAAFAVRPTTQAVTVPGGQPLPANPGGAVSAVPDPKFSLLGVLCAYGIRLLTLLVLGWLAALLAAKGASLARGTTDKE